MFKTDAQCGKAENGHVSIEWSVTYATSRSTRKVVAVTRDLNEAMREALSASQSVEQEVTVSGLGMRRASFSKGRLLRDWTASPFGEVPRLLWRMGQCPMCGGVS